MQGSAWSGDNTRWEKLTFGTERLTEKKMTSDESLERFREELLLRRQNSKTFNSIREKFEEGKTGWQC